MFTWWFKVTFLGWLSDLQLGDKKATLNHLVLVVSLLLYNTPRNSRNEKTSGKLLGNLSRIGWTHQHAAGCWARFFVDPTSAVDSQIHVFFRPKKSYCWFYNIWPSTLDGGASMPAFSAEFHNFWGLNRKSVRQLKYLRNYLRNYWTFQLPPQLDPQSQFWTQPKSSLFFRFLPKGFPISKEIRKLHQLAQRLFFERTWTNPFRIGDRKTQGEETSTEWSRVNILLIYIYIIYIYT